ncbi:hypothetical protein NPIL_179911 [Nephila pilipes]|uniref:Uncharacterized protein n=1 Tax=Nephila pilipes TaxID=299642 RepID=A0A8X6NA44_NEPPI|nr:hypothetical protein NPIL_179911 [Nephila pilipes]
MKPKIGEVESQNGADALKLASVVDNLTENKIELYHILESGLRKVIIDLTNGYESRKTETTNLSMKIVLKDESSIYQRPYRLSVAKRLKINEQFKE